MSLRRSLLAWIMVLPALSAVGQEMRAEKASETAPETALAREFAVRGWALDPSAQRAELIRAAGAADWRARFDALDALRRAATCGSAFELPLGAELRADPHPNVRELALALALAPEAELTADELARLVRDPFPGVRLALTHALASRRGASALAALLELCGDPDARVARSAAALLLARGEEALAAKLEFVERGAFDAAPERFDELLGASLRAPLDPDWIEALRARLAARASAPEMAAMRALWEALAYARVGAGDARVLAAGWLAALAEPVAPVRRELLSRAARSGDRALFDALLDEFARMLARGSTGDGAAEELLDAALEVAGARFVTALFERLEPWPPEFAARAFARSSGRVDAWPAELLARWLDPARPRALRLAACAAAGAALVHAGDRESARALARCLEDADPELRRRAFEALCDAADPRPWLAAMHRYWRALPGRQERLEALRKLSRRYAPTPFRDDLIALWEHAGGRVPSVLELLERFSGDLELAQRIEVWSQRELAFFDVGEPPPVEVSEGAWREAEGRAQALVRALQRVGGDEVVDALEALLARVDGRSVEVAKVCAGMLARSERGRARLAGWMRPEASSRVRIEAALGLVGERTQEAVTLLIERYPSCDEELRLRILRAFGALTDPRCLPLLVRAASRPAQSEGDHSEAETMVALEALGLSARPAAAVEALATILATAEDLDLLRGAVASLAQLDEPGAVPLLLELLDDPARVELARDEALPALARLAPERLRELLLALPLARAEAELAQRFLGQRLPAREFVYRGELEAAERLAERGLLGATLEAVPGWWKLDGRLLLELGRVAARAGERPAARLLSRAARVALAGEGAALDLELQRCGARALDLSLALDAGDWPAAEATARALLLDWRTGVTSQRAFELQLGPFDPRAGRDPEAWLAATELQAAAFAAHRRGARDEARALALRAERSVGRSSQAREQQAALDAALR